MGVLDEIDKIAAGRRVPHRLDQPTIRAFTLNMSLASDAAPGLFHGGAAYLARAAASKEFVRWRFAYAGVCRYPRSAAARKLATRAGTELRDALTAAARAADSKAAREALQREAEHLSQLLDTLSRGTKPAGTISPDLTELARLELLVMSGQLGGTASGQRLQEAFRRYHNAKLVGGAELEVAADELADSIGQNLRAAGAGERFKFPGYYRKRIMTEVRRLQSAKPQGRISELEKMLDHAVLSLTDDGLQKTWPHVAAALATSPGRWARVAAALDRIAPVTRADENYENAKEAALSAVKGALAEMLAKNTPAFRDALAESKRQAHLLADSLNRPALRAGQEPSWQVTIPEFDVLAPKTAGRGMALFVDQAVLVVNESTKQAYLLFAAQVKAGDASTEKAVEQMVKDQRRLLKGTLQIADRPGTYELLPPPDIGMVNRVFVGSSKGVEALRRSARTDTLSGRVRLESGPVDGMALSQFAEWMLRSTGKLD